jgi:hypothetical protein
MARRCRAARLSPVKPADRRGPPPVRRAFLQFVPRSMRAVATRSSQGGRLPTVRSIDPPIQRNTLEPAMTKTAATQVALFALAALTALAMLAGTNALAGHQYRVAAAAMAQAQVQTVAADSRDAGQRVAQL